MSKNEFKKLSQKLLNEILANEAVLMVQTLNYHWNLVGPEFHDYHLLFGGQYTVLFADLDKLAERVRSLGGIALGSMKDMIKVATLKEDAGKTPSPRQMVINLLKQYEELTEQIRDGLVMLDDKKSNDFATVNLLETVLEQHEKTAWMLRSLTGKE